MKKAFSLIELSIVILVIGLLVAGVSKGSLLVIKSKLNNARSLTQSAPVASTNGLLVWWETTLEASFINTESENGYGISTWYDVNPSSSVKFNVTQSTSNNKPTYVAEAINGIPSLKFDGVDDYFSANYSYLPNPTKFTIFAVNKPLAAAAYGAIFSSRSSSPGQRGYMFYLTPSSTYQVWLGDGVSSWGDTGTVSLSATMGKTYVLSATYDGSTLTLYSNGTSGGSVSRTFVPTTTGDFRLGAGKNGTNPPEYYLNGYLGELIIFDRVISNEERQEIEKYLGKKWGVKIS